MDTRGAVSSELKQSSSMTAMSKRVRGDTLPLCAVLAANGMENAKMGSSIFCVLFRQCKSFPLVVNPFSQTRTCLSMLAGLAMATEVIALTFKMLAC